MEPFMILDCTTFTDTSLAGMAVVLFVVFVELQDKLDIEIYDYKYSMHLYQNHNIYWT